MMNSHMIEAFDFGAPAEVFITAGGFSRGAPMTYRRFSTAAAAVRFVVEEVPHTLLIRATMEVAEDRFDHRAIRTLYDHKSYPLARRAKRQDDPAQDKPRKIVRRASIGAL